MSKKDNMDDFDFFEDDDNDNNNSNNDNDNSFDFGGDDDFGDDPFDGGFQPQKPRTKQKGIDMDTMKYGYEGKNIDLTANKRLDQNGLYSNPSKSKNKKKGKKFKGPGGGSARPTNDKGFDPALGITKKKKKGRGKRLKKNKDNFNFYEEEEPKQQADQMTYGASKQNHDDDIFAPEPVDFSKKTSTNTRKGSTLMEQHNKKKKKKKVEEEDPFAASDDEDEFEEEEEMEEESEEIVEKPKKKKKKKKKPKPVKKAKKEDDFIDDDENSQTDPDEQSEKIEVVQNAEENKPAEDNDYVEEETVEIQIAKMSDLDLVDMKVFLTNPPPKGKMVQCTIIRDKGSFAKRMSPKYHVYLSHHDNCYLMSGKKRGIKSRTSYFIGDTKKGLKKGSPNVVAKLSSNFLGTEFHMFDGGMNPKKTQNVDKIRKDLGIIRYEKNLFGMKGPRKMFAYIPGVNPDGSLAEFKPMKADDNLFKRFTSGKREGISHLINKPPKWSADVEAFVLDFYGRVKMPSVKNFQLIKENDEDYIYLQFGKVDKHEFNMDFQWPMTPSQAFAICLSSFDFKLACE